MASPSPPAPVSVDVELMRRAFIRKAHQAIHQVLFFIGLGYKTTTLGYAVRIFPFIGRWKDAANQDIERASHELEERIRALVESVGWDQSIDSDPVVKDWKALRAQLTTNVEFPLTDDKLRDACEAFLVRTRPARRPFWTETVPTAFQWFRKVVASLLAVTLVVYLSFRVEQVGALFVNAGWIVVLPAVVLMVPILLTWVIANRKRRDGRVYFWDIGGVPFRSFRHQALPPERGFPVFAEKSPLPLRLSKRVLANAVVYVSFLAVVVGATYLHRAMSDSTHLFTAVLVLGIFYSILFAAFIVDFWDFWSQLPIRLLFIGLAAVLFVALNWENGSVVALVFLVGLLGAALFQLRDASAAARNFYWLVSLPLAGLIAITLYSMSRQGAKDWVDGSASVVRLDEDEWPVPSGASGTDPVVVLLASGGGSRAAVYTAMTLQALHEHRSEIACNLQAISSVSGGSLANAAYVAARLASPDCASLGSGVGEDWLVDRVNEDYILATLEGLINGKGRGLQIEDTWRTGETALGTTKLSELVSGWRRQRPEGGYPPFPVPLFNTTTLDTFDVVISPLSQRAYGPFALTASAKGEMNRYDTIPQRFAGLDVDTLEAMPTWVYYRGGIYGLEELVPRYDPDLAESVRASANFPFGFPLVRVKTEQPLHFSPLQEERKPGERTVYLSDGGVLSNSGMWSMYQLLMNHATELKERGVLLVIVEASKMPSYPRLRRYTGLLSAIENKEPLGRSMHRRMLDALTLVYGSRFEAVQIDLVPTVDMNVMTTWTLSRTAEELLAKSFALRWACNGSGPECTKVQDQIDAAWSRLKAPQTPAEGIVDSRPRPPLS